MNIFLTSTQVWLHLIHPQHAPFENTLLKLKKQLLLVSQFIKMVLLNLLVTFLILIFHLSLLNLTGIKLMLLFAAFYVLLPSDPLVDQSKHRSLNPACSNSSSIWSLAKCLLTNDFRLNILYLKSVLILFCLPGVL